MFLWEFNTFLTDFKVLWQESMQYYLPWTHIVWDFLILVIPFASVTIQVTLDKVDYLSM